MGKIAIIGLVGNSAFMSVENFHIGGETIVAKDIHFEPGGKGFNQAVAAARFGAEVSFLGAVGKDYFDTVKDFSKSENISAHLSVKDGATSYASIITDSSGNTRVTVYQGASLDADDVKSFEEEISSSKVLLINNEVPEDVNVKAVEIAKLNGVFVIMNPAPQRDICRYLLDNVDLFIPNEHETKGLENKTNVLITLGKKGVFIKSTKETAPAVSIGKTVDTTGAGDTFCGILGAGIALGIDLSHAVKLANLGAGISVTRKYAVSSIPTAKEIRMSQM